mgnify:CR=1 FL=1
MIRTNRHSAQPYHCGREMAEAGEVDRAAIVARGERRKNTVRYLGVDVEDALLLAERTEI